MHADFMYKARERVVMLKQDYIANCETMTATVRKKLYNKICALKMRIQKREEREQLADELHCM